MEPIDWDKIREEMLRRRDLWFQSLQVEREVATLVEKLLKDNLHRAERLEKESEHLATILPPHCYGRMKRGRQTIEHKKL